MKRIIMHSANEASYLMLNYTSAPVKSPLGIAYAKEMVAQLKLAVPDIAKATLLGHLHAWNVRGGSPFSNAEISAFAEVPAADKVKKSKKQVPAPGVPLLAE